MKNNRLLSYLSLGCVFVLFNVLALAIPTEKTVAFWTVYAFSIVAFAVQIPLWKTALFKNETLKSKFIGIPVIHVGLVYLIIQLIICAVFMIIPSLPLWLAIVACAIILVLFVLSAIAGQVGANEINRVEDKIKIKRAFIQFLQTDIEMLAETEADAEMKAALKKLAEKVRFSDPMSHEMLGELESRIVEKVESMKTAEDKAALVAEVDLLLTERNKKCKILK